MYFFCKKKYICF